MWRGGGWTREHQWGAMATRLWPNWRITRTTRSTLETGALTRDFQSWVHHVFKLDSDDVAAQAIDHGCDVVHCIQHRLVVRSPPWVESRGADPGAVYVLLWDKNTQSDTSPTRLTPRSDHFPTQIRLTSW